MSRPSRRPLDPDLYADVVAEAKSRFDVWPSAYASGWVVKTYKARGGRYAGATKGQRTGLTKWFGESWVDLSRPIHDEDGELVGYEPCGRKTAQDASNDPAAYPKCRPLKEAMRMSPSEVKDAIKRKRAAEAKAGRGGRGGRGARAPVRVATYRANPDVTSTPTFRRWFGDSKVVDAAGKPLVVYHGAPDVRGIFAGGFKRSQMRGDVFFATDDPRTAETYTDPHRAWDYQNAEPGVIPLYLRIENPLVVDAGFQHWRGTEHVIEKARKAGHDGVIIQNTIDHYASDRKAKPRREDACTVFAFFSPTQVKSALTGPMKARDPNRWHVSTSQPLDFTGPNDGTFDLDDADLRSNPYDPEDDPLSDVHVIATDELEDGTVVKYVASPFPYERKPLAYNDDPKVQGLVNLANLIGTQRRVSVAGVEKYLAGADEKPPRPGSSRMPAILVYETSDGRQYIADGHHRAFAALLRDMETFPAIIQLVRE